jgi:hypothetical protein
VALEPSGAKESEFIIFIHCIRIGGLNLILQRKKLRNANCLAILIGVPQCYENAQKRIQNENITKHKR